MAESRTIDNLGPEASTRWAQDQNLIGVATQREGALVTELTQKDISIPAYTPELQSLLKGDFNERTKVALIPPPEGYMEQNKHLFSSQITPRISKESIDLQLGKIQTLSLNPIKTDEENPLAWETEKLQEDWLTEQKKISASLETLQRIHQDLVDINSRRTQYQKG